MEPGGAAEGYAVACRSREEPYRRWPVGFEVHLIPCGVLIWICSLLLPVCSHALIQALMLIFQLRAQLVNDRF